MEDAADNPTFKGLDDLFQHLLGGGWVEYVPFGGDASTPCHLVDGRMSYKSGAPARYAFTEPHHFRKSQPPRKTFKGIEAAVAWLREANWGTRTVTFESSFTRTLTIDSDGDLAIDGDYPCISSEWVFATFTEVL